MFGRNRRRNPEPTFAEKQAEYECAFQNAWFLKSNQPLLGLGADGMIHSLRPVARILPSAFPDSCESKIVADTDNLYKITTSGKLLVQVCVECPREDCPTAEGLDDTYRNLLDGSYVVIDATETELEGLNLESSIIDPKQITS